MNSVVYFIKSGKNIKIGFSKNLQSRLRSISTSCVEPIELLHSVPGGSALEREIHLRLSDAHIRGEWFRDCSEVRSLIASAHTIEVSSVKQGLRIFHAVQPACNFPLTGVGAVMSAHLEYVQEEFFAGRVDLDDFQEAVEVSRTLLEYCERQLRAAQLRYATSDNK